MIMVPAGTPEDRVKVLTDAAEKTTTSDTVKNCYEKYGSTLLLVKGEEASHFIKQEIDRRAGVIEAAGVPTQRPGRRTGRGPPALRRPCVSDRPRRA